MRILLAEDERELSRALAAILQHAGYLVDVAPDGEEALGFVFSSDYDLVILDIMMPKVDGLTVLRRMREEGIEVPVLMLTAKSEIRDRVEGLDSGANDYLTKPFAAAELLARIRVLTRTNPAQATADLSFGDLALDADGCRLVCDDKACDLTQREYQIMEMLVRHPQMKVSVDQFMRKIWGGFSDVEPSVVWVNISNLRKKIAGIGSRVKISAARNVGYYLDDSAAGRSQDAHAHDCAQDGRQDRKQESVSK
jgi:two-component system response regulator ArlR